MLVEQTIPPSPQKVEEGGEEVRLLVACCKFVVISIASVELGFLICHFVPFDATNSFILNSINESRL